MMKRLKFSDPMLLWSDVDRPSLKSNTMLRLAMPSIVLGVMHSEDGQVDSSFLIGAVVVGGVIGLVTSVNGRDRCLLDNCQVCFFSEYLFQGRPVSNARKFQQQEQVCGFSVKQNITDMIALTHECPGHNLITLILTHLFLRTISGVTVTCRTVWLFEA